MVRAGPWGRISFAIALLAAGGSLVIAITGHAPPLVWLTAATLGLLVTLSLGIFFMSFGLFARPILAGDPHTSAGRVALTFDDGPDPAHTPSVLDLLERHGHRGTFFIIGRRGAEQPELLTEIVRRGHALANHSFGHARATAFFSVPRLIGDLQRAQATIAAVQDRPSRWFRPPAGVLSPRVTSAASAVGLELVGWTASARDGIATTVERAHRRLERAARPGAILVLHDGAERGDRAPIAAKVLEQLCQTLAARGLRSVTLDELLDPAAPRSRRS
jgi:peptidoglycan/xylan/chitin deacetylase (PgdA/CDA1 family)